MGTKYLPIFDFRLGQVQCMWSWCWGGSAGFPVRQPFMWEGRLTHRLVVCLLKVV